MNAEPSPEQMKRWLRQADHDLEIAQGAVGLGGYEHAAFLAEQAAEKYLKALWMAGRAEDPPRTHDLVHLASDLGAPDEVVESARLLSLDYMATRYPDVADETPAEQYTEEDALSRLEAARLVIEWVTSFLGEGEDR